MPCCEPGVSPTFPPGRAPPVPNVVLLICLASPGFRFREQLCSPCSALATGPAHAGSRSRGQEGPGAERHSRQEQQRLVDSTWVPQPQVEG